MMNVSWRRKVQRSTCVAVRRVRSDHEVQMDVLSLRDDLGVCSGRRWMRMYARSMEMIVPGAGLNAFCAF